MKPTVSVIVNTLNRGGMLRKILECFQWLKYEGKFEVIVVNGPSTDNTEKIIEEWGNRIRAAKCGAANLSASRNIGIELAKGEIVAFIDDDAYPEPEWLAQMVEPFSDESVGAVGGIVFDHTGFSYQYEYRTATRLLNCNWAAMNNGEHLCFPCSYEFPYPPGGNAAYRRSALLEVGGFDEEIEYYGDETDVTVRLIDAGYLVRNIVGGYIHHKSAASNIRNNERIVRNWYPIIKNKIYFSIKHGRPYRAFDEILQDNLKFSAMWRDDVTHHITAGRLTENDLVLFEDQNRQAWEVGVTQGLAEKRKLLCRREGNEGNFALFPTHGASKPLAVVLVSQYFPPHQEGGIPTLTKELGESLANLGQVVHVVTQSPDINRVDFEAGVWVHRVVKREFQRPQTAEALNVPQRIWDWSATAFEEVKRIGRHRVISVVEAPIWDCQGIAFLLDRQWPVVTSLQTTLRFWLDSHPELRTDSTWMASFGNPMLSLEKEVMLRSDSIRSISRAIRRDIETEYRFEFEDSKICIAPLGMSSQQTPTFRGERADHLTVLFVGRLEYRKGIDVLLAAIPKIHKESPLVRFRILGDDSLEAPGRNASFKELFLSNDVGQQWSERVRFEGRVDAETLRDAYKSCDIFVAPSRFESFGLVFLEAMREAKPVVGCLAGGIPEVVSRDVNGLLVPPGDVEALSEAILRLVKSETLRTTMGAAGRKIFLEKFTSEDMARSSLEIYEVAERNFRLAGE
jgi:glycosyltransferase involved in cell wall biosynthesis